MDKLKERFLKYVGFDTTSDEESTQTPSTSKQLLLGEYLYNELNNIGVDKAVFNKETGIVYAWINPTDPSMDSIGLIAHMDTSPDASGKDIKPCIIRNYDGEDIKLNSDLNIVLSPNDFPSLLKCIGHDLVVTDGTTLLGADDKAGIAIIMSSIENIIKNKELKHGKICIAITPDEEVGRGTENFDIEYFGADYAYTIDGGDVHTIEFETFNACSAEVTINGLSIHPGSAYQKMINASLVAMEFDKELPQNELPEKTRGYQGFHHLLKVDSKCEKAIMHYIIRNHDESILEKQKQDFINAANNINAKYGKELVNVKLIDGYRNMRKYIEQDPRGLNKAIKVYRDMNENVMFEAVRGGTDGSELSKRGLPTPNLGTGGANYHGNYEYVSLNDMAFMVKVVTNILTKN